MYLMKNMKGQMGNQFFQYAFMRAVQEKYAPEAEIVLSFRPEGFRKPAETRSDYLQFFRTRYKKALRLPLTLRQKLLMALLSVILYADKKLRGENGIKRRYEIEERWQPILLKHNILWCINGYRKFDFAKIDWAKNVVFYGYFESPKYFRGDRMLETLCEAFTPQCAGRIQESPVYRILKKSNSVCLHVRRGDFVASPRHDVCDVNYYQRAIDMMLSLYNEPPRFAVFTDDPIWVRENLSLPDGTFYENGDEWDFDIQYMMRACRHFIISNSTFSWWAQYLADRRNDDSRIIIAPKRWWADADHQDIYQDNWILIDN